MNELPSTEFRKRFARLTEQTMVTVNGHPIGVWIPGATPNVQASMRHFDPPAQSTQAKRDELLRKINRG